MLRNCTDVVARCGSNCDLSLALHLFKVFCTCEITHIHTHTFVVKSRGVCNSVNTAAAFLICFHSHASTVPNHSVSFAFI